MDNTIYNTDPKPDIGAIWIGYLHPQITLKDLLSHFEHCGYIWQAKIMRTTKSVHPFAFLWFEKPSCAKRALDMDRSSIYGSSIKVRFKRIMESDQLVATTFQNHTQATTPSPVPKQLCPQVPPFRPAFNYTSKPITPNVIPCPSMYHMIDTNQVRSIVAEGSNLVKEISAMEPIHIANPDALVCRSSHNTFM